MTTATKAQPDNVVTKTFFNLAQFKSLNEGDGRLIGHASVCGNLDDVGDIILAGAYENLSEFSGSGFLAGDHQWTFSQEVGLVLSAKEDSKGLLAEYEFHSTPDAQAIRQKILKRMKLGKPVKMSIGYAPTAQPLFIYPNQYDRELPKYLKPQYLKEGLAKARQFERVRILPRVKVFEGSVVQIPANSEAEVMSIKSTTTSTTPQVSNYTHEIRKARLKLVELRLKEIQGIPLTPQDKHDQKILDLRMGVIDREVAEVIRESRRIKQAELQRRINEVLNQKK